MDVKWKCPNLFLQTYSTQNEYLVKTSKPKFANVFNVSQIIQLRLFNMVIDLG